MDNQRTLLPAATGNNADLRRYKFAPLQINPSDRLLLKMMPRNGELITAAVRQSDPNGHLTLEIEGKLLRVLSALQVAVGSTLRLRVEQTIDQSILHLDKPEIDRLIQQRALRQSLPHQGSLKPLLGHLVRWRNGNATVDVISTTTHTKPDARLSIPAMDSTQLRSAIALPNPIKPVPLPS